MTDFCVKPFPTFAVKRHKNNTAGASERKAGIGRNPRGNTLLKMVILCF